MIASYPTSTRLSTGLALFLVALPVNLAYAAEEIGALGRLIPRQDVRVLAGPPNTRIQEIRVSPGDVVEMGATLVVYAHHEQLELELELAKVDHEEIIKSAAIQLRLQELALATAERNLRRAKKHLESYKSLASSAIVERELANREYQVEDGEAEIQINQNKLRELRLQLQIEERRTDARLRLAQFKYHRAALTAPIAGTVLEVNMRVGDVSGRQATILLADLTEMYVVCEIYEGDILRVKPGMRVVVKSAALPHDLTGVVETVGQIVNTRSKLARSLIRLDSADVAQKLIGLEVTVSIIP